MIKTTDRPSFPALSSTTWKGKRVLITGHTGFKGSWLSLWLSSMGADVTGLALPPETQPSMFNLCEVGDVIASVFADVRDAQSVLACLTTAKPEVVIHLAAQPLVRRSYVEPSLTYATNVMGTLNVLDAVRFTPSVRAVLIVTSDKCYLNQEWEWPYREDDALGGFDPYSSSKAAVEIAVASYRSSFFGGSANPRSAALVATARAGNVIGGGDWSADRLVPDLVRSASSGVAISLRYPDATRPWQHVLEPLHGYLAVCERLMSSDRNAATAWNFGPSIDGDRKVSWIAEEFQRLWGPNAPRWVRQQAAEPHEAGRLSLDWSRAYSRLGWHPFWSAELALRQTVEWYRLWANGGSSRDLRELTTDQIKRFVLLAKA